MKLRIILTVSFAFSTVAFGQPQYNPALWSGMKYRMIGPSRGGGVTAVTGVPSQPLTYYMGSTGGGVWKTVDAGNNWVNVSDGFFSAASLGAIEFRCRTPMLFTRARDPTTAWLA